MHGLSVEMTEALAEYWHRRIREEWGFADEDGPTVAGLFRQQYRGSRYSWGYPACPDLEDQAKLDELLDLPSIGVHLTEEFQLEPEQSTSAIIVPHPEAKYFIAWGPPTVGARRGRKGVAYDSPHMKGLILCGGAGTRLRPITHTSAKQLVPVANKPILFYGIEDMAAAGITDIGIIVGDTRDEIMAAVGDGSAWGVRRPITPRTPPPAFALAVVIARDFLGDDDFVMYLGDNLLEQGLTEFVDRFEAARARSRSTRPRRRSCSPTSMTHASSVSPR